MMGDLSDLDYRSANAALRRAALSTVFGGVFGGLVLAGLIAFAVLKATSWQSDRSRV
jgi:hypothetical protein